MGNYRFRMSDMIPNAWFYKLNDVKKSQPPPSMVNKQRSYPKSSSATQPKKPAVKPGRASYYIPSTISTSTTTASTVEDIFPNSPVNTKALDTKFTINPSRKSKKIRPAAGRSGIYEPKPCVDCKVLTSSAYFGCGCCSTVKTRSKGGEFSLLNPPLRSPDSPVLSGGRDGNDENLENGSVPCSLFDDELVISSVSLTSSSTDIILDINNGQQDFFPSVPPPVLTKPITKKKQRETNKTTKPEDLNTSPRRRNTRSSAGIHRLKTRANSPRSITNKRNRRSKGFLSESFLVVKTSSDPQRDFRDSMMEMIVENRITAVKDLQELLACYLSLNSDEYHDVIVKVFENIWFFMHPDVNLR